MNRSMLDQAGRNLEAAHRCLQEACALSVQQGQAQTARLVASRRVTFLRAVTAYEAVLEAAALDRMVA